LGHTRTHRHTHRNEMAKGSDMNIRGLIWGNILGFACRDCGKSRKNEPIYLASGPKCEPATCLIRRDDNHSTVTFCTYFTWSIILTLSIF
jgi:hypothetical protein